MERQSGLYFTTGEFIRILGVRKHTLFHYDEIDLFLPALKEENGYRCYSVWQMDMFEVIHALQKLGMSLGETKKYMENRPPERFMSMMDGKKRQTDEEIQRLKNMKRLILHEGESVQLAMKATLDESRLVERGREYLPVSDIGAELERKATVEIVERVRMQGEYHDTVGAVGSIYPGEDTDRNIYNRYAKVYTGLDKKTASRRAQSRPERVYVELYSREHLWDMEKPRRPINAFVGERGIRLDQMWYEDPVLDELTVEEYEQHIIKVMVSVESRVISP